MQFFYDGRVYRVVRITGPSHNLLGIQFSEIAEGSPVVHDLWDGDPTRALIAAGDVEQQVLSAVEETNSEFNVDYRVQMIQFVSSDTPSSTVYRDLARELLERIVYGGQFKGI